VNGNELPLPPPEPVATVTGNVEPSPLVKVITLPAADAVVSNEAVLTVPPPFKANDAVKAYEAEVALAACDADVELSAYDALVAFVANELLVAVAAYELDKAALLYEAVPNKLPVNPTDAENAVPFACP